MLFIKLVLLIFITVGIGVIAFELVNYATYKRIYNRGIDALALGELKEAEKHFRKVAQLKPTDYKNLYNLGLTYFELGKHQRAEDYFLKAMNLKLDDVDVYYNLGLIKYSAGKKEEAVDYFKKALDLSESKDEATLFNISIAYTDLQDYEMAIQSMSKVIELKPRSVEYRLALAEIYEKLIKETGNIQNVDFAIDTYQDILELDENHELTNIKLAKCLAKKGEVEQCKQACQRALISNTKSHEALHLLGIVFFTQQKFQEAIQHFEQAFASRPNLNEAYLYAAYGYANIDNKERTEELYMKFLEKAPTYDARDQVDEYFQKVQVA